MCYLKVDPERFHTKARKRKKTNVHWARNWAQCMDCWQKKRFPPVSIKSSIRKAMEIARKGAKHIRVISCGADKMRMTAAVALSVNNDLLAPFLIYRGKRTPNLKLDSFFNKVEVRAQQNAWMTGQLFKDWVRCVLEPHCRKYTRSLLIMDQFRVHETKEALYPKDAPNLLMFLLINQLKTIWRDCGRCIFKLITWRWTRTIQSHSNQAKNSYSNGYTTHGTI